MNCRADLNELQYFNVCSGALVPDIMHDVLEGALPLEMKLMLGQLVFVEKLFTVAQFQACLDCLDLGYMEVCDRPTPITDAILRATDSSSFKQAGMCILAMYLICSC